LRPSVACDRPRCRELGPEEAAMIAFLKTLSDGYVP